MKCAAFELPFTTSEQYGKHDVQEVLGVLEESGFVHRADADEGGDGDLAVDQRVVSGRCGQPRSISSDNFVVVDTTDGADVIGETSFNSGPSTLHEKAIYLVEGVLYQVEKLDFEGRKAYVRRIDCDYYTDAITYTKVTVLETFAGRRRLDRTARSTCRRASSASRRSSSTRTRTSARASSICPSSRCTPPPTG